MSTDTTASAGMHLRSTARAPSARVCLLGATDDTGNLGVSALMESVLSGISTHMPGIQVTVFDHGFGVRHADWSAQPSEIPLSYLRLGMRHSRRIWRPESLWHMRLSSRLRSLRNVGVQHLLSADAVWDLSGGDSFSDLYGPRRWQATTQPKRLSMQGGRLFLLPQTYGPFRRDMHRREAIAIVRTAAMAWARDPDSFAVLQDLLADDFDDRRHRQGVDVAFGLPARPPTEETRERLSILDGGAPVIGLNVSGLLHNDPHAARRYGLAGDYRSAIWMVLRSLLATSDVRILLVPHVRGHGAESDDRACEAIFRRFTPDERRRMAVAPPGLRAAETKWLISQLDWFCGTRMHATIAALSSGVPAAGVAYSPKTRGVFATCGVADHVADARVLRTGALVEAMVDSFNRRAQARAALATRLPTVRRMVDQQMEDFVLASVHRRSAP